MIELENVLLDALKKLDIEMFREFYNYIPEYTDFQKRTFEKELETALIKFIELGDTSLEVNLGKCQRCNKGCYGYQFIGNKTKNYIQLLFYNEADKLIGITECTELKVSKKVKDLKNRVYIKSYRDPSSEEYVPF